MSDSPRGRAAVHDTTRDIDSTYRLTCCTVLRADTRVRMQEGTGVHDS